MTKRNTDRREERILDAAAKLIAQYGYDKTTISDVAEAAGVSKGAVYLHWTSKEELFDALIVREMQRLLADLMERVEVDPQGGSITHMYRHALLAMQNNPLMRALYTRNGKVLGDYMHSQEPSRYVERFWFGKSFVEFMQRAGLIRAELDPEGLAYVLSIVSYGFASIESIIPAEQAPSLDKVSGALDALVEHGIARADGDMEAGKQALRLAVEAVNRQYRKEG
jgi:AcrR family transcriptional regulator